MLTVLLAVWVTACAPLETDWRADPNHSTEVELSADLSTAQVAATYAAVEEINAAVGREVFHVQDEHPGSRGHVTVTAQAPRIEGAAASTGRTDGRGIVRLGTMELKGVVVHELLHTLLGEEHATDPADLFYPTVYRRREQSITDATVERIHARMEEP